MTDVAPVAARPAAAPSSPAVAGEALGGVAPPSGVPAGGSARWSGWCTAEAVATDSALRRTVSKPRGVMAAGVALGGLGLAAALFLATRGTPSKDASTSGSASQATTGAAPPSASVSTRVVVPATAAAAWTAVPTTPHPEASVHLAPLPTSVPMAPRPRPVATPSPAGASPATPGKPNCSPPYEFDEKRQQAMRSAECALKSRLCDPRRARITRVARVARVAAAVACASALFSGAAWAADPTKDQCIDANETAQSLRKNEKLREAEQRLLVCVSASCPGPVRDDCGQRLTEVRAVTPTIVFVVKDDADQDLSDVHVTLDDQPLADKLDGTAIAIDPGQHRLVFESPGKAREERALVIREGEKDRHERIVLVAAQAPTTPVASVPESTPVQPSEAPPSDGKSQRIASLAVGGVGVAGVIVGGIFGIVSKSTWNKAKTECTAGGGSLPDHCMGPSGPSDSDSAHTQAAVSTVAFIAGGALVATGVVLYLTAPKAGLTVSPTVGLGSAPGLDLRGSW